MRKLGLLLALLACVGLAIFAGLTLLGTDRPNVYAIMFISAMGSIWFLLQRCRVEFQEG